MMSTRQSFYSFVCWFTFMLRFCFRGHCHLVLSFMFHFLFPTIFVVIFTSVIFFLCCFYHKCHRYSSVCVYIWIHFFYFALFFFNVYGCCLMPSLHQKLLNGAADLDEKKTCNFMHFILFSTLVDFCVNPITVVFHLVCNSQVPLKCLDTVLKPAPYKINPTYIL